MSKVSSNYERKKLGSAFQSILVQNLGFMGKTIAVELELEFDLKKE